MTPSPPSTGPSDARGRRSSAFVRERHAPIDARGRPALSRSAGCVLSDPPGATWETTHGPGMGCRTSSFPFGPEWERHSCRGRSAAAGSVLLERPAALKATELRLTGLSYE